MRAPRVRLLILLLVVMVALMRPDNAGALSSTEVQSGITDRQILIGSCSALSGSAMLLGTRQLTGARAYLNSVNDAGGVNGRKIKLLTYDDGYDPDKAEQCFAQMLKDNVFAGAFFVGTPTAARYVPKAEMLHIPLVGLFSGAQLTYDPFRKYVFTIRASYSDETREQIDKLWESGIRKIGVIYQDDAFGAAVLAGVQRALKAHNSDPVALGTFRRNTVNVDDGMKDVRKGNPEAVILVGPYTPVAEIVKRSHLAGWKPIFTTVSFVGTEAFVKAAGKDADGMVVTQVMPPYTHDEFPTIGQYKKLMKKYFPQEELSFTSLEGFVDAMVLVEGLKRAGKELNRASFISALETMHDWDLGLGKLHIAYTASRHKGFDAVYATVIRNEKPVLLTDWKHLP